MMAGWRQQFMSVASDHADALLAALEVFAVSTRPPTNEVRRVVPDRAARTALTVAFMALGHMAEAVGDSGVAVACEAIVETLAGSQV